MTWLAVGGAGILLLAFNVFVSSLFQAHDDQKADGPEVVRPGAERQAQRGDSHTGLFSFDQENFKFLMFLGLGLSSTFSPQSSRFLENTKTQRQLHC